MDALLSVIVPVYHTEKFLDECIESITNQTYKNLQIILVDDGSPDRSGEICEMWGKRDPRIQVIHQKNAGQALARSVGLRAAAGDWVAFVDSDDYIAPEMAELLLRTAAESGADIAEGGHCLDVDGEIQERKGFSNRPLLFSKDALTFFLEGRTVSPSVCCGKVFRRSLWEGVAFPNLATAEDLVVLAQLLGKMDRMAQVDKVFYYYRQNADSVTKSPYSEKNIDLIKALRQVSDFVLRRYPDLADSVHVFCADYILNYLIVFSKEQELKKRFPEDYKQYTLLFKESIRCFLRSDSIPPKRRLEALLVYLGLYRPFWMLKHSFTA